MNGGKKQRGYTIIEVMIVLAASGLMFVIAANFISGKQAKTSFRAGVDETASRIDDVLAQVTGGHYSDQFFGCTTSSGSPHIVNASSGNDRSGKNSDCVFLGKFMHFNTAGTVNDPNYSVYSLAGNRVVKITGLPPKNLTEANPTIIKAHGGGGPQVDLTLAQTVPQTLDIRKVTADGGILPSKGAGFGFVQGLGTTTTNGKNYQSGSQTVTMVASTLNINPNTSGALSFTGIKKAALCMTDNTRWAVVTVTLGGAATKFYNDAAAANAAPGNGNVC
jgi:prepilin-type N-terminal cleavage/methylation domain-containing protein